MTPPAIVEFLQHIDLDEEWKLRRHGFIRFIIKSTLLGGFKVLTILKNDEVRQWVSDDIPYMK